MSAYDNPSIIKNDTALIWGQVGGNFAESFAKSFTQAKETREAKEKELRLTNERKEKESDQLKISQQITKQNLDAANQKIKGESVIPGMAEDDSLSIAVQKSFADDLEIDGENDVKLLTTVQPKEFQNAASDFKKKLTAGRQASIRVFGGISDSSNTYAAMTASATTDIVWEGATGLDQLNYMSACRGLNPANLSLRKSVNKEYIRDKADPSKNTLRVTTDIGDEKKLKEQLRIFYVGDTEEELDKIIKKGVEDKQIIQEGKNYKLNFEKPIGQGTWDGTFYKTIPKLTNENLWGDKGANIVDERTQELDANYLTQPSMRSLEKKVEGQVQYIKIDEILKKSQPYYLAEAAGLLEGPLSNNTVLQGYLSYRTDSGKMTVKEWTDKFKTTEEQKADLARMILQKDIKTKLGVGYQSVKASREEKDKGLADFNGNTWIRILSTQEVKPKETTPPKASDLKKEEEWKLIEEGVNAIDLKGGSWTGPQGQKVTYREGRYIIDTPGNSKDDVFDNREQALQYLKKGYYK